MIRRSRTAIIAAAVLFALSTAAALAAFAPASLLTLVIERATEGRLTIAGASGRIWAGRATLLAPGDPARVLIAWTLSPWRLMQAQLAGDLRIGTAQPVRFVAERHRLELGSADITLPASLVASAIGAFGGYRIGGSARVHTQRVSIDRDGAAARLALEWDNAASALIDVSPLGSYSAELEWSAQSGGLSVRTRSGPLFIDGGGRWSSGGAALHITARATGGRADTLKAWLRTMTPEQADGGFRFVWPQPIAAQRGMRS